MPPALSLTAPSSVRSAILVETKTKPALSAILTTSCVNSAQLPSAWNTRCLHHAMRPQTPMKPLAIAAPLVLGCLASFADPLAAQPAADSGQALVIERGSDYAIVQLVTSQVTADGLTVTRTNSYTALETGMHYLKDGNWLETQERIQVAADGSAAYATQGPSQAIFSANANSIPSIDLLTPDSKR